MTAAAKPASVAPWSLQAAMAQVRTPVGGVLMATAGIGVFMAAHWQPLVPVMLAFYFVTLLAPTVARHSASWFVVAAIWAGAVITQRDVMEDHVYLYLAWLVAIAVGLVDRPTFLAELARHGRYLVAVVFGFATAWKLLSGSFVNGSALWTIGLLDDRMGPLFRVAGISQESLDQARPAVVGVVGGRQPSYDIALSTYSSTMLVLIALGTIALEAGVAFTHAVPDSNRLARLRAPILVMFGIVTYAVVPVLPFALLLAVMGCTIARFERRTVIAFALMVVVTLVRVATL